MTQPSDANQYGEYHNTPNPTSALNGAHGYKAAGVAINPISSYTTCQHSEVTHATDGKEAALVRCSQRAILMPGYYRACAEHVLQVLQRSLGEYASREAAQHNADELHTLVRLNQALQDAHKTMQGQTPAAKKRLSASRKASK